MTGRLFCLALWTVSLLFAQDASVLPLLRDASGDSRAIRDRAQRELRALLPTSDVLDQFVTATRDEDPKVRALAAETLGGFFTDANPTVPAVVALLDDEQMDVRVAAATALWHMDAGGNAAIGKLRALARHGDAEAGRYAVYAIAVSGGDAKRIVKTLTKLMNADQALVLPVLNSLGTVGDPTFAIPVLVRALHDADPSVRRYALLGVGMLGSGAAAAMPQAIAALDDPDSSVRADAQSAVHQIGLEFAGAAAPKLAAILLDDAVNIGARAHAANMLGQMGAAGRSAEPQLRTAYEWNHAKISPAALEALIDLGLEDAADHPDRVTYAEAMQSRTPHDRPGYIPTKEALRALIEDLESDDTGRQSSALSALQDAGPSAADAVPGLIAILNSQFRSAAADALASIGPPSIPGLLEALADSDEQVRGHAAYSLGRMGPRANAEVAAALARVARSDQTNARHTVAKALGRMRYWHETAVPALVELLSGDIRLSALEALATLGHRAAAAVPQVAALLDSSDDETVKAAVETLRLIGEPASPASAKLGELMATADEALRERLAIAMASIGPLSGEAQNVLLKDASDPSSPSRVTSVYALGHTANTATTEQAAVIVSKLVELIDSDPRTSNHAILTLGQVGAPALSAWAKLEAALSHPSRLTRHSASRAIGQIAIAAGQPERAVPLLIRGLADLDRDVRADSARTLGKIGPPAAAAVPALRKLRNDHSGHIKNAAREALRQILEN